MHCVQYASNYVQSFFVYIDISKKEIPSGYTFCENGLFEYTELKNDIIINQYAFSLSGFYHPTIQSIKYSGFKCE